jgi:hypothetical protein
MPPVDCSGNGAGEGNADVWFTFTATQTQHTVHVQGADIDAVFEVFKDVCGSLNQISCSDATGLGGVEEKEASGLQVGEVYHVRVYHHDADIPASGDFEICVFGDMGTAVAEQYQAAPALFPNPGTGDLTLTHNGTSGTFTLEVFDMTGRKVVGEQAYLVHGAPHSFNWSGRLAKGSYSLRLTGAGEATQQRFVVK